MSLPAILWAMYEAPARTNPTEKCVLMVLAEHADPSGASAFPSWQRIAKTVGVSTRTIGSTLSSLQAKGLIRRGDQRIAEAAVRRRGKSRAYAPTVWDLVMDGSHAAATQAHLPPAVDEDREAAAVRAVQHTNRQLRRPAKSADLTPEDSASLDRVDNPAGEEPCRYCRSSGGCSKACSLASPRPEVSRRSGVKPASDKPSTSTTNLNPPPRPTPVAQGRSSIMLSASTPWEPNGSQTKIAGQMQLDATDYVAAVRAVLPPSLARQASGRALERRCAALAAAGWSIDQVAGEVRGRCWDGAGVGAVVAWLADVLTEGLSASVSEQQMSTGPVQGRILVEEYRRALEVAAASDSPARKEAIRLAAAAATKSRDRRMPIL